MPHKAMERLFSLSRIRVHDHQEIGRFLVLLIRGEDGLRARPEIQDVFIGQIEMIVENGLVVKVSYAPGPESFPGQPGEDLGLWALILDT